MLEDTGKLLGEQEVLFVFLIRHIVSMYNPGQNSLDYESGGCYRNHQPGLQWVNSIRECAVPGTSISITETDKRTLSTVQTKNK
jgi:hypothetical protein